MVISFKALCQLLDISYVRYTLNGYVKNISDGIFKSSVLMAHKIEDYQYLDIMVSKKDAISEKYVVFLKPDCPSDLPLSLEINRSLNLFEFAVLFLKTDIHIQHFICVIESIADGKKNEFDAKEKVKEFKKHVAFLKKMKLH